MLEQRHGLAGAAKVLQHRTEVVERCGVHGTQRDGTGKSARCLIERAAPIVQQSEVVVCVGVGGIAGDGGPPERLGILYEAEFEGGYTTQVPELRILRAVT